MPRLRRIKDYEIDFSAFHQRDDEEGADETSPSGSEIIEQSASPKGWWSNEAMVASMADAKLREALGYHRSMLATIQRELVQRSLEPRPTRRQGPLDYQSRRRTVVAEERQSGITHKRRTTRTKGGLKLPPDQMIKALEALCQLMNKKQP